MAKIDAQEICGKTKMKPTAVVTVAVTVVMVVTVKIR